MNLQQLVIATMSWARDKDEEELLRLALNQLSSTGIRVFITDGGSPEAFVNEISRLHQFTVMPSAQKGLWPQVRNSLKHAYASGAPFVFYTEPDKLDFFKTLPQLLNSVEVNEETGAVLATRSADGMASFPAFQQMTETTINNCCAEVIKQGVDYTYGPFLLNKNVIPHLEALPMDTGWGWRPYAFNITARLGLHIRAKEGNYFCPASQQQDNAMERVYRMKQLAESIQGLVLSGAKELAHAGLNTY